MSNLVCKGICKKYKDKMALDGVDLTIEAGKIYGLIGRNGAGKTTLLSILTAQNPATSGTVELDGEKVWENQKALDKLCFSRELNVAGNNGIGGMKIKAYLKAAATYYPNWDQAMADKLIETFGINVKKAMAKVNKGMLSAVTITVALASRAEFTFLDEPVAGLDVIARETFYKLLLEEFAESGRTFIISTHIIEEAANVFEEVIMVKNGKLLRKVDTQLLVDSGRHVTGLAEEVDKATEGLEVHHAENLGRSKAVTVLLGEGESLREGCDVTAQPVSLQNIFVALCGEESAE